MEEREYIIALYDIYKELFTTKQRDYFENYYFEDYSLSEISENNNVSRAMVSKTVNNVVNKLKFYESKLGVYHLHKKIEKLGG